MTNNDKINCSDESLKLSIVNFVREEKEQIMLIVVSVT